MKPRTHLFLIHRLRRLTPLVAGVVLISNATDPVGGLVLGLAGALLTRWAARRIGAQWWRGVFADRYQKLLAPAVDAETQREHIAEMEEMYQLSGLPADFRLRVMTSFPVLLAERFGEGRAMLESIDLDKITDPHDRALVENNLAWALAHDGQPVAAQALARTALARLDSAGAGSNDRDKPHLRMLYGACLGTLGGALVGGKQYEAALEVLGQALAVGGEPRVQQIRWYYFGVALDALGRVAEAIDALGRAATINPESTWGKRAADRFARMNG